MENNMRDLTPEELSATISVANDCAGHSYEGAKTFSSEAMKKIISTMRYSAELAGFNSNDPKRVNDGRKIVDLSNVAATLMGIVVGATVEAVRYISSQSTLNEALEIAKRSHTGAVEVIQAMINSGELK